MPQPIVAPPPAPPPPGFTQRKSPLGYTEYVVPPQHESEYFNNPNIRAMTQGDVVYYRQATDVPSTRTHERIHVGQNQLQQHPGVTQVMDALPAYAQRLMLPGMVASGKPETEPAAYLFNTPFTGPLQNEQQDWYNKYINLVYRADPRNTYNVEAAMPPALVSRNIATQPRPVGPPAPIPQMQERSLLDLVMGR